MYSSTLVAPHQFRIKNRIRFSNILSTLVVRSCTLWLCWLSKPSEFELDRHVPVVHRYQFIPPCLFLPSLDSLWGGFPPGSSEVVLPPLQRHLDIYPLKPDTSNVALPNNKRKPQTAAFVSSCAVNSGDYLCPSTPTYHLYVQFSDLNPHVEHHYCESGLVFKILQANNARSTPA